MTNGVYHTKHGSTVTVSGKHSGIFVVDFDWFEEGHACTECRVDPVPSGGRLTWDCDICGGGSADLLDAADISVAS